MSLQTHSLQSPTAARLKNSHLTKAAVRNRYTIRPVTTHRGSSMNSSLKKAVIVNGTMEATDQRKQESTTQQQTGNDGKIKPDITTAIQETTVEKLSSKKWAVAIKAPIRMKRRIGELSTTTKHSDPVVVKNHSPTRTKSEQVTAANKKPNEEVTTLGTTAPATTTSLQIYSKSGTTAMVAPTAKANTTELIKKTSTKESSTAHVKSSAAATSSTSTSPTRKTSTNTCPSQAPSPTKSKTSMQHHAEEKSAYQNSALDVIAPPQAAANAEAVIQPTITTAMTTESPKRPTTAVLKHNSMSNLPECDPDWIAQYRSKIHRRARVTTASISPGYNSSKRSSRLTTVHRMKKSSPYDSAIEDSSASEEAPNTHTTIVRSGTATLLESSFDVSRLPVVDSPSSDPEKSYPKSSSKLYATKSLSQLNNSNSSSQQRELRASRYYDRRYNRPAKSSNSMSTTVKKVSSSTDISSTDSLTNTADQSHEHQKKFYCHRRQTTAAIAEDNCGCCCCQRLQKMTLGRQPISLGIGRQAPNFKGPAVVNGAFKDIRLTDYSGKILVIFFYPKDFNATSHSELLELNGKLKEFRKYDSEVLAISTDSQYSHLAWVTTPTADGGLGSIDIPLLCDSTNQICRDYGVLKEDDCLAYGGVYVIDRKSYIRAVFANDPTITRNTEEILRVVAAVFQ